MDEDDEITECPACGKTYDDADADFLICHHCGYDADDRSFKQHNIDRSRAGIDPEVEL